MRQIALLALLLAFAAAVYGQENILEKGLEGRSAADVISRRYVTPLRLVALPGELTAGVENPEALLRNFDGQLTTGTPDVCRLSTRDGRSASVLLDFGKELCGGIALSAAIRADQRALKVRIRLGESVSEAMSDVGGDAPMASATNEHSLRDFTLGVPWLGNVEAGNSGFRFVRIDLVEPDAELNLKAVRAILRYRDVPYLGSFRCDDERLNRIWETGAYTVHLNMQEFLWDGVKRDRLVWVGDLHPEIMTVNSVFGYNEVVPRSLDLARDTTPLPGWMNGISSYSLWWIIIHSDWYRYHGDRDYLAAQRPYLTALLRQVFEKIGSDGRERLDGTRFLDWPSSDDAASTAAGLQSLTILALDAGAGLCEALGDAALAAECRAKAVLMRKCPVGDGGEAKQGRSLMVLAGLADAAETDRDYISKGGSAGFSTFYGYYMLRAMAAAGNYEGALERIREYWGAMLDLGATTFWEDFNMEWLPAARIDEPVPAGMRDLHRECGAYCYKGFRHSLCHGWSSAPTAFLAEEVLGIRISEPGCKKIRIAPRLGNLEWAEGKYPTPYGTVTVSCKNLGGEIKTEWTAPPEITVITE